MHQSDPPLKLPQTQNHQNTIRPVQKTRSLNFELITSQAVREPAHFAQPALECAGLQGGHYFDELDALGLVSQPASFLTGANGPWNAQDCREGTNRPNNRTWTRPANSNSVENVEEMTCVFLHWSNEISLILLAHVVLKPSNWSIFASFSLRICNISFLLRRYRFPSVGNHRFRANYKLKKRHENLCKINYFVIFETSISSKY